MAEDRSPRRERTSAAAAPRSGDGDRAAQADASADDLGSSEGHRPLPVALGELGVGTVGSPTRVRLSRRLGGQPQSDLQHDRDLDRRIVNNGIPPVRGVLVRAAATTEVADRFGPVLVAGLNQYAGLVPTAA